MIRQWFCHYCRRDFDAEAQPVIARRFVLCPGGTAHSGHSEPIVKCPHCGATSTLTRK